MYCLYMASGVCALLGGMYTSKEANIEEFRREADVGDLLTAGGELLLVQPDGLPKGTNFLIILLIVDSQQITII